MTQDETWLLKEKYLGEKSEGFFTDCARLKNGKPLAYLIGHVPFLDTVIFLDSHPLIPRPETEFWVEKAILEIHARGKTLSTVSSISVLDLCAGSGCIGVAVGKATPTAKVDFAEIDQSHHDTILKNIKENNIKEIGTIIFGGDLFEKITRTYDFILTNPPYIDPALDRACVSVKNYEPHLALYGGAQGLELISLIIAQAHKHLCEHGVLYIEHEPEHADLIVALATSHGFMNTKSFTDQYGTIRFSRLTRGKTS